MNTITPELLQELHRIHRQLAELNYRRKRGPRQVAAGENAVARADKQAADLRENWKKMRMKSDEQQLQLKQREAKIADLERKLNECKTNTEFKLLRDQIAAERQANGVLEDEIYERLDRLDAMHAEVKQAEEEASHRRQEMETTQQRVEQEQNTLDRELQRVTAELHAVEQDLPADFRSDYQRLVRAHGPDSLAPVEGETCGGCHTLLPPQTMNELYMSRAVFCKSCGCVLYLAEGRTRLDASLADR